MMTATFKFKPGDLVCFDLNTPMSGIGHVEKCMWGEEAEYLISPITGCYQEVRRESSLELVTGDPMLEALKLWIKKAQESIESYTLVHAVTGREVLNELRIWIAQVEFMQKKRGGE